MSQKRFLENLQIDSKYLDIQTWPMVNTDQFTLDEKEIFQRRQTAVMLFMQGTKSSIEIKELTNIDAKEIRKYIKRCLTHDPLTNTIWGFRALIPHKRIYKYQRKTPTSNSNKSELPKLTGAFSDLLRRYPEIEKKVISAFLRRRSASKNLPALNGDGLHIYFLKECEKQGIGIHDYPFNTEDKASRSLYRYLKKIEQSYFVEAAKRNGSQAFRSSKRTHDTEQEKLLITRPYHRVQFDGHKIDAIFTITFTTPEGDTVTEVMERVWLLLIVDVATRAILGHYLSFNKEYNSDDVLHCIRNSIIPYKKISFTIPGITYHEEGGIPSAEIPECAWALWNEFSYDNGRANLANIVTDRLYQVVECTLNPGPVETPEVRGIIERLFKTLEVQGYHKLVSTTGSNPSDPLRKDPEKKAKRYSISIEELEELTHVLISDYNGIPHSGINNFSPIKLMRQRIERGMEPRVMEPSKRRDTAFFTLRAKRKVNGSVEQGKRPFITFEGITYRSEVLSHSPHLIGAELILFVNIEDIRTIRAFLKDGSEFGYLTATGKWGTTPHSLRTRQAINKLKKKRKIFFTTYDDPFQIYHEYKVEKAKSSKRERNQYAQIQRELTKTQSEKASEDETIENNYTPYKETEIDDDSSDKRHFRTYTF
ncbi:hypothetical protein ABN764_04515 [Paenibacillaceae sp. P-4]|uniref:hypothetical protein n=1 Tax=Paenibacillaceae bacterium P-4 TaxID=3160969 RepID=UPI0032E80A6C